MNKRALGIIGIIVLAIIGGFVYLLLRTDPVEMPAQNTTNESATETPAQTADPTLSDSRTAAPGQYIEYSDGIIAATPGTKLLFFHAPWCPQCRALEADIKEKGVPEGVTIIEVDYDSNQGLRQKYGVTLQTTLVKVDDSGELIEKFVSYDDPSLDAVKSNLLL